MKDFHGIPLARLLAAASVIRETAQRTLYTNFVNELMQGRISPVPLEATTGERADSAFFFVIGSVAGFVEARPFGTHEEEDWWYHALRIAAAHLENGTGPPPEALIEKAAESAVKTLAVVAIGRGEGGFPIIEFAHHPQFAYDEAANMMCRYIEKLQEQRRAVN